MRSAGVVAALTMASCWTGKAEPTGQPIVQNSVAADEQRDHAGAYWCAIETDGYGYDKFPCVIRRERGHWRFAKLGGSVRLRGFVKFEESGDFRFKGEQYCPWGDCTEAVEGRFTHDGTGGFKANLSDMAITMLPAGPDEYGGASYGGDGYGNPFGYDGTAGGQGYGGQFGGNPYLIPTP